MRPLASLFAAFAVCAACNSIDGADKYQNVDAVDGSGNDVNNPDTSPQCTQACLDTDSTCQGNCESVKQDCLNKCSQGACQKCTNDFNSCTSQCVADCSQGTCNCPKSQCQTVPLPDAATDAPNGG